MYGVFNFVSITYCTVYNSHSCIYSPSEHLHAAVNHAFTVPPLFTAVNHAFAVPPSFAAVNHAFTVPPSLAAVTHASAVPPLYAAVNHTFVVPPSRAVRCGPGFIGERCDAGQNLCDVANPCANGGTCNLIDSDQECTCSEGQ